MCVCVSVCPAAACLHYSADPDVTWRSGRGCPLVVHCWADLQSVHGLRCYGAVPARRLPTSLRRRVTASSRICWSATAERTAPEAENICPAGFLRGWSVGVELVAGLPERPGSQQRHFLQAPKDVFVCSVLIYVQRIRGRTTMRCINLRFTYLLTYYGNITRTRNVSEHMLVLAVCLVSTSSLVLVCHVLVVRRLDQQTVGASSLNVFKTRLSIIRTTRMGFFMD